MLQVSSRYTYPSGKHICTPDMDKLLHFMVFGYLYLDQTDTNPWANSESWLWFSFPPLHSWWTHIRYFYRCGIGYRNFRCIEQVSLWLKNPKNIYHPSTPSQFHLASKRLHGHLSANQHMPGHTYLSADYFQVLNWIVANRWTANRWTR